MNRGIIYGILAYTLWGIMPVYWKLLHGVDAFQILLHRIIWSLFFLLFILMFRKQWSWITRLHKKPVNSLLFLLSALFLAMNWGIYIWAVMNNHLIDASLGYFINPLVNVLLGVLILKERMRFAQWIAVSIAACGVIYLTLHCGELPWIALVLAGSFAIYGLLRKTAHLGSLEGLSLETAILFIPALVIILVLETRGSGAFLNAAGSEKLLLIMAGPVTALPLLLFASAARRIRFSTVGLLQYISPTLQLVIGVLVNHEHFSEKRPVGFCIIWFALFVYSLEGWIYSRSISGKPKAIKRPVSFR